MSVDTETGKPTRCLRDIEQAMAYTEQKRSPRSGRQIGQLIKDQAPGFPPSRE